MSTLIEDAEDVRAMEQKAVKERPILFSGAMVRAILSGQKTQTRRVIKPQPEVTEKRLRETGGWVEGETLSQHVNEAWQAGFIPVECPYGQPGDRLWVREAFHSYHWDQPRAVYRADGERQRVRTQIESYEVGRWKPSIHMPRWACRIVLEIVSVRVERLQDISEEDAEAEGILADSFEYGGQQYFRDYRLTDAEASTQPALTCPRESFRSLWESINGQESWQANPWVWVVEFRRVGK